MSARPEVIPFQDFVNAHKEEFTPFELWVVDELTDHLVNKLDLDKSFTSIVVDADEENPVGKITDSEVLIRLNGRFYLPTEDRTGKTITLSTQEWAALAKEWFTEVDLTADFNTESTDLLKFTVFVPALGLPEGVATEATEEVTPESEETPPEGEKAPEGGEGTETEEKPAEAPEEAEKATTPEEAEPKEEATEEPKEEAEPKDKELEEFEKALGM